MSHESPQDAHTLMDRLDKAIPPGTNTTVDAEHDPLVAVAQRLANGPRPKLSDAALDRIEARLRARTAELQAPPTKQVPAARPILRRGVRHIWRYALVASLALVLIITSVTQASASSLPGDTLYPVKRAIEDGRLALASRDGQPNLHVDFAGRRIDEFQTLLDKQHRVYPRALEEASDHLNQALNLLTAGHGNSPQIEQQIIGLAQKQESLIIQALPQASAEVQEQLQTLADDTRRIQQQTQLPSESGPATSITPIPQALPSITSTSTPSATPTATSTETATSTQTPTETPTPTVTASPSATPTVKPTITPTRIPATVKPNPTLQQVQPLDPTRTPPGHGEDPGLGDNPPGQGGDNPGIGNDGNPPGQSDGNPGQGNDGQPPGQDKPKKTK